MRFYLIPIVATAILTSCSTLPVPGVVSNKATAAEAKAILRRSSASQGNSWKKYQSVEVSYDGKWSAIATQVQPVLTDPAFRKTSREIYQPRLGKVRQIHSGPEGTKVVVREGRQIEVTLNGLRSNNHEIQDASALVADAYTVFLFGSSWLLEHGDDWSLLDEKSISSERCHLVAGRLRPGLGNSAEDHFIAWISAESGLLKRFQFTLNGMDSTRGADVDVEFQDYWKAADGSVWPSHFIEHIQRPILAKAHEWRMTSLRLDGRISAVGSSPVPSDHRATSWGVDQSARRLTRATRTHRQPRH